jgi:hypothetical protein
MLPNIADCLFYLISGFYSNYFEQCKYWFQNAIFNNSNNDNSSNEKKKIFERLINDEYKQIFLQAMFQLSINNNNRRFKSLIQDVFKICNAELNEDALLAYTEL